MSAAVAMTGAGFYGKLPAHGDFVRRALPPSFVRPWDDWLQAGMSAARVRFGAGWEAAWDAAPVWRFALPAGACGPAFAAGLLAPSRDAVGRRFPLTLVVFADPDEDWFEAIERLARLALAGGLDAEALAQAVAAQPLASGTAPLGWRTEALAWDLAGLPPAADFHFLVQSDPA